jgi:hypothetical protein
MSLSQQTHWRNISGPQTRTSRSNSQKGHWFGTTIYSFKNGTQIRGRSGTQAKPTQICSSMIISILLHNFLHCQVYSITPISYILFSPKRNSLCWSTNWYNTTQCNARYVSSKPARTEIDHTSPTVDQIQELGEEEAIKRCDRNGFLVPWCDMNYGLLLADRSLRWYCRCRCQESSLLTRWTAQPDGT